MSGNRDSQYELLERGIRLFERGSYLEEAFRHFSDAHLAHPETPEVQSWYALGLALARGEHETAIRLARGREEPPSRSQTFMNLARVYLACDRKRQAIQALKAALMADPDHRPAQIELAKLGRRRRRMLRSLDRGHPLNQLLGRARAKVAGR